MILILHDTPDGYPFIAERLTRPCKKIYSPQKSRKYLTWIAGAWKVMRESRKGDVIVSLYDFQGILCLLIGYLTFRRRHILGLNLLLKDKSTIRNRIASWLYKLAVNSPWFHTTVTAKAYQEWFNRKLGIDLEYPLLRDVYYDSYEPTMSLKEGDGSVFCGGRNSRDWDLMLGLASEMPDVKYRFVMPGDIYAKYKENLTDNVEAQYDVSMEEFLTQLNESSIVCLPVTTDAPTGLITMFQAAGFEKPIVTTDTIVTREYINHDRGYLLQGNDSRNWACTIREILSNYDNAKIKASEFHSFVKNECNEEVYVKRIEEIIDSIAE